jgi:UDP-glucuronate 4-epimerase
MKKILVTGAAGFIGFHYVRALCAAGHNVYGIDNLNDYYDPMLKHARLHELSSLRNFSFDALDLADRSGMEAYFARVKPEIVVNLGAQAGVRYSLQNPHAYIDSNVVAFTNILEGCRHNGVAHLIYASSSSVYGANTVVPFTENQNVDHPVSLYAATKKANELMAHTYAHLYGLPCTGLRFFTVYGPWGRPDMAYYSFTDKILRGEPIEVFNHGDMMRDFTYIDDIVESMVRLIGHKPAPQSVEGVSSAAPYALYNIGNNAPEKLMDFIAILEDALGRKAEIVMKPMQAGDVQATYADTDLLQNAIGFKPSTPLTEGLAQFVDWYRKYNGLAEAA